MTLKLNERVAQLEARLQTLQEDQRDLSDELKSATKELRALTSEMVSIKTELISAIRAVAAKAAQPFENLSWGWRVLAGIGTVAIGIAGVIGSILGIVAYLRPNGLH